MILKPIDLTVVPDTSVTIVIPQIGLENGKVFRLDFKLTPLVEEKLDTATGTEAVSIQNGVGGTVYPLDTRLGNVFYADRLIPCEKYRIGYGNNGAPGGVQHFQDLETKEKASAYNPGNATPASAPRRKEE